MSKEVELIIPVKNILSSLQSVDYELTGQFMKVFTDKRQETITISGENVEIETLERVKLTPPKGEQ